MAEIGCQRRQQSVYVLALAIRGRKAIASIAVAKVVDAGALFPFASAQPATVQGLAVGRVHNLEEEASALEVGEEGILWHGREDTGPFLNIALQYRTG